jgi:polar amino acid transport system substrate-binding protein
MLSKLVFAKVLGLAFSLFLCLDAIAQQVPPSPTLDAVRKSGVLRVGVKTDFEPFNYLDGNGNVVGFESDVAALIAERLGVQLQKVKLTTENRFQKLALGEVDILIATVADTPERRKSAAAVEPGYAETSVNVMFGPGHAVSDWSKIRNRTVCAVQGSYFNKPMSERYLLQLQTYKTVRDAMLALRDDQCSGFLYATAVLQGKLKLPEGAGYSMPLSNAIIKPMAIFIASAERGTRLDVTLGDIMAGLHRNGWLLDQSRAWGITSVDWLTRENLLWTQKDAAGNFICVRGSNGLWTAACRSSEYVASSEVSGVQALGLRLKEQLGIDLNFAYDPYDRTQFLRGLAYTMMLIASGMAIALALGVLAATAVDGRAGLAARLLRAFMAYGRLTPPLIMMYLIFFGIGGWTQREFGVKLPAFAVATFCSGFYTAGLVMRALLEAARHLRGIEPAFVLRLRTLYRTAHYASWPVKQALINLTKQTMLASAIAIPELLSASSLLIAENGNIFVTMTMLLITFYLTTRLWTLIIERIEHAILAPLAKP